MHNETQAILEFLHLQDAMQGGLHLVVQTHVIGSTQESGIRDSDILLQRVLVQTWSFAVPAFIRMCSSRCAASIM